MMLVAWVISVKRNYPKNEKRASFREIMASGREAFWALLMMVIILAGILTGIVTPTEASIIAVLYALFVGFFIYRELSIKSALAVIRDSMVRAAGIMVLVGFANVFAYVLTNDS